MPDIYTRNKAFVEKHEVQYLILKNGDHLHPSDLGYILGNFMGIVKKFSFSREIMELYF